MQDYEKKLLKNIFAENNLVNLDYLNFPERLVSMVQEAVSKNSQDSSPDKRAIIKKSISTNEQLMKFDTIANNRVIHDYINRQQATPTSSVIDQKQSTDHHIKQKIKGTSTFTRIKSQKDSSLNFVDSKGDLKSLMESKIQYKKDESTQGAKNSGRIGLFSGLIDVKDGKKQVNLASDAGKSLVTPSGKDRNIFSATTNVNSHGTHFKTRFGDQP
jgi:hypothetical protein